MNNLQSKKISQNITSQISVNVYGIKAVINSNDNGMLGFAAENYSCFKINDRSNPDLKVWFSKEHGNQARAMKKKLFRYGHDLYLDEASIYWENEFGFSIYIDLNNHEQWKIYGFHFDLVNQKNLEEKYKNYMRSMRWMIHFPIFLMLEKKQSKRLIHATAISKNGRAVVLTGLNKVGKSSLGWLLHNKYNYKFLSDNFLLADGNMVYAFPEKCRLSGKSADKLGLLNYPNQTIYDKYHIPIDISRIEYQADPTDVFVINNHSHGKIIPTTRSKAINLIESLHCYLKEFPEHTFYSLINSFDFYSQPQADLFPVHTRFFNLSFPLDWSVEETAKEVIECISTT